MPLFVRVAMASGVLLATPVALAQDAGPAFAPPAPAGGEPIDASQLSKVPRQRTFVEAEYPEEAFDKGIEADVVLLLDIDEQGKVTQVGISEPADPPGLGFDEAAMVAAQSWEFEPAELDGKPIAVQLTYRYKFQIKRRVGAPPLPADLPTGEVPAPPGVPAGPSAPAAAPQVNFAGKLVERGTRLPLAGVVVTVFRDDVTPPLGFETTSDAGGGFRFYDLAPGEWKVLVEAPGYYPVRTAETVKPGERVDVTYHVERGTYNPYDVTVTAPRPRKEVSRTVLDAPEIDKVPGGAGDPLTVVSNFAGVARSPAPGLLIVRGSAPEDSRFLIEGAQVPLIYHFGGLKSVLPIGVLESIEFYPGNFSPMYGRATGGIVDIRIKKLEPKKVGGYVDVSILDAGLYLEIPVGKRAAIAVAGRRSYIDAVLGAVIPDDAGVTLTTAPRYYDFQLLGNYRPAPAHDLRLFALASDDRLELLVDNPADIDPTFNGNGFQSSTTFYRALGTYRWVPSTSFENTLRLTGGNDKIAFAAGTLRFDIDLWTVQLREAARWSWGKRWALTAGADVAWGIADVFVRFPRPPKEGQPVTNFDLSETVTSESKGEAHPSPAVFVEGELSPIPGLLVLPGLRVDYFDLTGQTVVQPRVTARWQVSDPVTLKAGVGLFAEEPGFDEVDPVFGNPDLGVERALHYSAGAEYKPRSWITLDATAFFKDLRDQVSPTDELVMRDGMVRPLLYDNNGTGKVVGLELQARHERWHGLSGWISYTLSRAERLDSGSTEARLFDFDQTHILNLVASYQLPRNWEIGARFRVVSGNPTTPVVSSVYNASTDRYDPVYGAINSSRNAMFNQLDIRVDKHWIRQGWIQSAYLDIQNIYNRANAEGVEYNYDFTQSQAQTGIPILTIVGIRGEF